MNVDDYKRKKIRTYFFPETAPKSINNKNKNPIMLYSGWIIITLACISGGIAAVLESNNNGSEFSELLGGIAGLCMCPLGLLLLTISGFNILSMGLSNTVSQNQYNQKQSSYLALLNKWDLNESDLSVPPSTQQIDAWLLEDLSMIEDRALDRLGLKRSELIELEEHEQPLVIYGPLFENTPGISEDEIVYVRDSSGIIRFSCYQLVVVCLTAERVATYSANFNFLRYAFVLEKAKEFLYKDIVSVATEEIATNYTLPNGKVLRRAQVFRLIVPGDVIEVTINSPEIVDLLNGTPKLTNHDQSVRVIREMMRKKQR